MTDHTERRDQLLGNYRLIKLLGQGGFADVYLGEHIYLKTQAAIKVVHTRLAKDELSSFLNEAQTIARLEHPHIVRILDFGVEESIPFLVMNYAQNGSLRQHYPRGTCLPLVSIVDYVKQLASALQYAHDQKLIHRDIKPENMLLGRNNEILLSDFGIAVTVHTTRSQVASEGVTGTIPYMAPEQLTGKPRPASDQYSLGIVVYEWLCGHRPFHGTFTEIYSQHLHVPPPPLRQRAPMITADIEKVVMIALSKDPQQRFGSVRAFATALQQACLPVQHLQGASEPTGILPAGFVPSPAPERRAAIIDLSSAQQGSGPITTPPASHMEPQSTVVSALLPAETTSIPAKPSRFLPRRVVVASLAGLAVAGTTGGTLWWLLSKQQMPVAPVHKPTYSPTTQPTSSSTSPIRPRTSTLYTYSGHSNWVYAVAWSPDGKYIASGSWDKTVQTWDAGTGGHEFSYIFHRHNDKVATVAWSPDSKRIASGSWDRTVRVWDATKGNHILTYSGHSKTVYAVAWSPDGKLIASGSADSKVQRWDAATGRQVYTYSNHTETVFAVAWSPDSKRIASASSDATVQIWDVLTGSNAITFGGHTTKVVAVAWSPDGKRIVSGSWDKTA